MNRKPNQRVHDDDDDHNDAVNSTTGTTGSAKSLSVSSSSLSSSRPRQQQKCPEKGGHSTQPSRSRIRTANDTDPTRKNDEANEDRTDEANDVSSNSNKNDDDERVRSATAATIAAAANAAVNGKHQMVVPQWQAAAARTSQALFWQQQQPHNNSHNNTIRLVIEMACDACCPTAAASSTTALTATISTAAATASSFWVELLASCKALVHESVTAEQDYRKSSSSSSSSSKRKGGKNSSSNASSSTRQPLPHERSDVVVGAEQHYHQQQRDRLLVAVTSLSVLVDVAFHPSLSRSNHHHAHHDTLDHHTLVPLDSLLKVLYWSVVTLAALETATTNPTNNNNRAVSTTTASSTKSTTSTTRLLLPLLPTNVELCNLAYRTLGRVVCHSSRRCLVPRPAPPKSNRRKQPQPHEPYLCFWSTVPVALDATDSSIRSLAPTVPPLPLLQWCDFAVPQWCYSDDNNDTAPVTASRPRVLVLASRTNGNDNNDNADTDDSDDCDDTSYTAAAKCTRTRKKKNVETATRLRDDTTTKTAAAADSLVGVAQVITMGIAATMAVARVLLVQTTRATTQSTTATTREQQVDQWHRLATTLHAWLVAAAASTAASSSSILSASTIVSHCKAAQRTVWHAATLLDTSNDNKHGNETEPNDTTAMHRHAVALRLYQKAIELYLLENTTITTTGRTGTAATAITGTNTNDQQQHHHPTLHPEVTKLLRDSHFATACTMAWKVSESVRLPTLPDRRCGGGGSSRRSLDAVSVPLHQFHDGIGPLLDRNAATATLDPTASVDDSGIPASYFEYCAYRALHCCRKAIDAAAAADNEILIQRSDVASSEGQQRLPHCCHVTRCCFANMPLSCPYHSANNSATESHTTVSITGLALVHLALQIRQGLECALGPTESARTRDNQCASIAQPAETASILISNVQQFLLCRPGTTPPGADTYSISFTGLRLYKVLSAIQLHKVVQRFLAHFSDPPRHSTASSTLGWDVQSLITTATILADSLVPLYFQLHAQDDAVGPSVWTVGIINLRNAIALVELVAHIVNPQESVLLVARSLTWMNRLVNHLVANDSGSGVPQRDEYTASTAKYFYGIGKKRFDAGNKLDAVPALLLAMQLFVHLSVSSDSIRTLQISSRFHFLAIVYRDLNMVDESLLAVVAGLTFNATEGDRTNVSDIDSEIDLVSILIKYTTGSIDRGSTSDQASVLGPRTTLEALFLQILSRRSVSEIRFGQTKSSSPLSPTGIIRVLLASLSGGGSTASELWEEKCGTPFSAWGILSSTFIPQLDIASTRDRLCVSRDKVKMLLDLMDKLGRDIQKQTSTAFSLLDDYKSVCRLAELCITSIGSTSTHVTKALLFVVASMFLISLHSWMDFDTWCTNCGVSFRVEDAPWFRLAKQYATKARDTLGETLVNSRDWDLLAKALTSSVELYHFQLSCIEANERIPHEFDLKRLRLLTESLEEASASSTHVDIASLSKQSILSVLSRLCGLFSLEGEYSCAIQLAKWCSDATKVDGDDPFAWFEGNVISRLTTESLISIQILDSVKSPAIFQPFAIEENACHLRLLIRDQVDVHRVGSLQDRFRSLLRNVDSISVERPRDELSLLRWTKTTILLGLSECAERLGSQHVALRLRQECFEECRKISSLLTKSRVKKSKENLHSNPLWTQVAFSSLPARCTERQVECIQGVAVLYGRLGDHRKSNDYALLSLKAGMANSDGLTSKSSFSDTLAYSKAHPPASCQDMRTRRLLLRLKATASPLDLVSDAFEGGHCDTFTVANVHSQLSMDRGMEEIKDIYEIVDMLNGYQSISSVRDEWGLHKKATRMFVRYSISPEVAMLVETVATIDGENLQTPIQLQYDAKLRDAALLLSDHERGGKGAESVAVEWLVDIVESSSCSNVCRAWSYFLLGSVALEQARESRHLCRLWNGGLLNSSDSPLLVEAKAYFDKALKLLGSSRDLLKRFTLRSQALICGPGKSGVDSVMSFELINASIGTSGLPCSRAINEGDDHDTRARQFLDQLGTVVSYPCRFVSAVLCPSGELLIASVEYSVSADWSCRVSCVFPESKGDMFDEIMQPLDSILRSSQDQLSGELGDNEKNGDDHARHWWNTRKECDSNLQELLHNVEKVLLSAPGAEEVLLGLTEDVPFIMDDSMLCENLAAKFEAADDKKTGNCEYADPHSMKVAELRTVLERNGYEAKDLRKLRKAELVQLLKLEPNFAPEENIVDSGSKVHNACTFLLLDEYLQKFPFEGLPMFAGKTVSRLPSLSFALTALMKGRADGRNMSCFDAQKLSYILDPESNLLATRQRLLPFLDSLQGTHGLCWSGIVGTAPSNEFMKDALSAIDGLFLYIGHGGGQQYYSKSKIENLGQAHDRALPSIILMGCSSGRLESVNTKQSRSLSKVPIHYEPEGLALTYLLAGAPCIVANLWDVTDRDIDRYSMALLESIFDEAAGRSIAKCVAEARNECKMRYIVGCAPVCYGFPVTKKR